MSGVGEQWQQRKELESLFSNRGKGAEAARLLEVGGVNKTVVGREQAVLLQGARVLERFLTGLYSDKEKTITPYSWVTMIINNLEVTQQAMAGEVNSRQQFMKVAIAQATGLANKAKSLIDNIAEK